MWRNRDPGAGAPRVGVHTGHHHVIVSGGARVAPASATRGAAPPSAIPMTPLRRGFTLIEILIVIVVIGIIAAVAIPRFASSKEKVNVSTMKADLRNLATAQVKYFGDFQSYAMPADGDNTNPATRIVDRDGNVIWAPSAGVRVFGAGTTTVGDSTSWAVSVSSVGSSERCSMYVGTPAASAILWSAKAQQEGEATCH